MKLTITLPLPHKSLSPNYTVGSRGARLGKAAKIKKYRMDAMHAGAAEIADAGYDLLLWKEATVQATFYHKDRRRRDSDNLLGSLKSAFDGLKDSGLILDDSGLTHLPVQKLVDKANPRVELTVWETKAD